MVEKEKPVRRSIILLLSSNRSTCISCLTFQAIFLNKGCDIYNHNPDLKYNLLVGLLNVAMAVST